MTEWEDLFEMSKRWPDIRKPKEHILDTESKLKLGTVRGEFLHWFEDMQRIGDEMNEKLEAVNRLLIDICEEYGTETCQEDVCDCDPNGWEGCLTRQILEILEAEE